MYGSSSYAVVRLNSPRARDRVFLRAQGAATDAYDQSANRGRQVEVEITCE
jgi:hypothetical protein